ncbi:FERM, ARHGEF and pleckstrin domain-containing protein 1 isoform X4 [Lepeophtheirus salmonis]|uniref:FERM, ARHGEF and pleckstrin domain-containing protein 1 isoform X4 n=1 Tax=Lepeophtheirus salmonis TaxID=72036 RepID=UPI003AF3FC7C
MSISREGTLNRQYHRRQSGGDEDCGTISGCASGGDEIGGRGSVGGGRTPPPRMRAGKMMAVKVKMLDDSITLFQVQVKAQGKILFDQVCKQLNLLEVDYFGLEYQDQLGVTYWVDVEKQMNHQIALTSSEPLFLFCVKFYTPDPAQIEEEYTRYLFSLQIKRDLATGLLQCNDNTAALMASYIVQAECGDYVIEDYPDHTYLSSFKFVPQQDADLERRIMENHKKHVGQSPAEADLNLLETARRCELYGTKMHAAKDHDGMPLNLAVAHMGAVVFQNYTKINTFSWAKIRKLSFKRKRYIIKLHPDTGCYRDTVEFYFEDRNQCKNFWKKCVEHHGFFRCTSSGIRAKEREKRRIIPRGSSFRYSGKTQKEMQEFVRENFVKRQSFHRHVRNLHSSMGNVSQSFSAQPLLPLGEALADEKSLRQQQSNQGFAPSTRVLQGYPPLHNSTPLVQSPYSDTTSNSITLLSSPSPSTDPPVYSSLFPGNTLENNNKILNLPPLPTDKLNNNSGNSSNSNTPYYKAINHNIINSTTHSNNNINNNNNNSSIYNSTSLLSNPPDSPIIMSSHRQASLSREDSVDASLTPLGTRTSTTDTETRRKRYPTDKAYFIAKEILMTERTYKKDLEIINLWFRDEVNKEDMVPEEIVSLLFSHLDPIYELHCNLLKDIEQRMATWEGRGNAARFVGDHKKVGDILLRYFDSSTVEHYLRFVESHLNILQKIEASLAAINNPSPPDAKFQQVFKDFESQKVCYLPICVLLLKPLHRILHYELLLKRLINHYNSNHHDYNDTSLALSRVEGILSKMALRLEESENFVKLSELQRDVGGPPNNPSGVSFLQSERKFIREGSLQKLSRKGYQQRMFFLFSDMLVYANRATSPNLYFRIHNQLSLKDLTIIDSEPRMGADHCFNICEGKKALLVSAVNEAEKDAWMNDIKEATQICQENGLLKDSSNKFLSLKSMSGSEDGLDRGGVSNNNNGDLPVPSGQQQRTNSSVHVCWHRSTTVSAHEVRNSLRNGLSGYLLRKFKNSNGWQKLWVVFTSSCLYFFKTYQDDFPLASLPLLGYAVEKPDEVDNIQKDFVFKLQFKNHVYFFRAESQYTYERWIEVLSTVTKISDELNANG